MLHLANDLAEVRQVTTQHTGLIHAPQCMRDALRCLQDFHEQCAINWVTTELIIYLEARIPQ